MRDFLRDIFDDDGANLGYVVAILALVILTLGCSREEPAPIPVAPPIVVSEVTRDDAVTYYAWMWAVDPALVRAVSHVENWRGIPTAVSSAGAIGVMQVMPFWMNSGHVRYCGEGTLYETMFNACMGVRILRDYQYQCYGGVSCALRRYNGSYHLPKSGDLYVQQVANALVT